METVNADLCVVNEPVPTDLVLGGWHLFLDRGRDGMFLYLD